MSGGRTPRVGLPTRFQSALEKLSTLFAMALWDAKANSCAEAWSEIKKLKSAKRKNEVIDARAQQWREESAKAIRNWSPKFVQFADACSEVLDRDILDWCRDKIWQKIETQCGIHKPNVGQLPRDTCSRSVEWWLAVASAGNPSIHLPQSKPWTPPRWLAGDGKEKASLLKNHTRLLGLRLDQVITEELALAEIQRVSIRRSEQSSARRAHKKQSNVVRRRAGVVFGAIQAGLVGLHYCRYLDKNRVIPLPAWVSEGCPKTYVAAYTEGKPWRKKIQDEKHRFTLKFESTAPQQREQLIQAATRSTRL
jgi:hypothetical protein